MDVSVAVAGLMELRDFTSAQPTEATRLLGSSLLQHLLAIRTNISFTSWGKKIEFSLITLGFHQVCVIEKAQENIAAGRKWRYTALR